MELKQLWETQKEFFAAKRGRGLLLLLGIAGILLIFLSELIPGQEQKAAVSATAVRTLRKSARRQCRAIPWLQRIIRSPASIR